jgi:D-alanine-D-alanine ligase
MNSKPNIAVVSGGDSSEFVVSVKSGVNVFNAIDTEKYNPWLIQMKGKEWIVLQNGQKIADIDKSDFCFLNGNEKVTFSFAYITIHGTPGEDGILQGYFELLGIPYSTCNVHTSSLTFNKWFCNNYLSSFDVKMAKSMKFSRGNSLIRRPLLKNLDCPYLLNPTPEVRVLE